MIHDITPIFNAIIYDGIFRPQVVPKDVTITYIYGNNHLQVVKGIPWQGIPTTMSIGPHRYIFSINA